MNTQKIEQTSPAPSGNTPHFDVLIIGAGLSGIGAAHYIQSRCPDRTYAVLEMRPAMGGTWDLFRYPGIRSDSDMYTLGYAFRPWREAKAIADGPAILKYIRETAEAEGIDRKIQYNRRLRGANWVSAEARWHLAVENTQDQSIMAYTCNFLFMCSGYYSYDEGYTPDFEGLADYQGLVIHPQKWPEDLDYTKQKIIVIGSGATAVTLVPELAKKAQSVIMLQRSPTYIVSMPSKDFFANWFKRVLPEKWAYEINRWRKVLFGLFFYKLARNRPNFVKKLIKQGVSKVLGKDYDVDTHFSPKYNPWDQRLCLVPDEDLFLAIKSGRVEVVTDQIAKFTEKGILLQSGKELPADIVVTATGLKMSVLDKMKLQMDGQDIQLSNHYMYRAMMVSDIPNLAISIGYTNASWTLKTDLTCAYVCRLLNYMRQIKVQTCTPRVREAIGDDIPLLDFNSSYVLRALPNLPKQGTKKPWRMNQNYPLDVLTIKYSSLKDPNLEFK
ncbi:MAG: NAD(P)/FAD-dependent oxidoreductase [Microscillaceae bacterium]|jgi:cation diffusion facilitator CzcD-associated flavoprotein CzcO|nr:NAD(P)/FAD-dependent oxidoreductase [Microscillaceae bacterium]